MDNSKLRERTEYLLQKDIFNNNNTNYDYLPEYLSKRFDEYLKELDDKLFWEFFFKTHFPDNVDGYINFENILKGVSTLSENILSCVDSYYKGKVSLSYNHLCAGLKVAINVNDSIISEQIIKTKLYEKDTFTAYRIRRKLNDSNIEFNRNQMFHIPFDLREKVTTQRYSIPGHPSLYLGDSIYVCWEELDRPLISNVFASKIVNDLNINVFELINIIELKERLIDLKGIEFSTELFRFLITYPLNIACSIPAKNTKATFKPEYIIPQLLLQYIIENHDDVDGIKYYSTKINYNGIEKVGYNNFVFPTRTNSQKGFCNLLREKFKLTEPTLWEYEQINTGNVTFYGDSERGDVKIELIKGRKVPYDWTTFRAIEVCLGYQNNLLKKCD